MTDLRTQIEQARRAGYSDDEITGYLKQSNPNVVKALESGYSPQEVLSYLAPAPSIVDQTARLAGIAAKGAAPGAIGATAGGLLGGVVGGPPGAAIGALTGSLAVPAADALTAAYYGLTGQQGRVPSQIIRSMIPGPQPETRAERMVEAAGEALGGAGPQVAAGRAMAGMAGAPGTIGREVSRLPRTQIAVAPVAGATATGVGESTESPLAGLAAGAATGAVVSPRMAKLEAAPTSAELTARSKAAYATLDQSGFQLDPAQFGAKISALPAQLRRDVGYVEAAYPKVASAFRELQQNTPKDTAELQALRKIIQGAKNSADPQERLIASRLMDEFDDYLLNAPASAVVGGNKSAIDAWNVARQDYAKMKKSEIFEEIIRKSELSTNSTGSAMASALSSLAKNDKKMRFFSSDERAAIEKAAKGSNTTAVLDVFAKFTPMTPAAAIFTAVAPGGALIAAGGLTSKGLSTRIRERTLNELAAQMRQGRSLNVLESPFANVPALTARGAAAGFPAYSNQMVNSENALAQ
jgi:hypothetical protein